MVSLGDIRSNNIRRCAYCGIPINKDNDSGWEVFIKDGKTTQPICGWCDVERSRGGLKSADSSRLDKTHRNHRKIKS